MLVEHVAYKAKMLVDVLSVLAITRLHPADCRGCEAKLPGQSGMKKQHVPNIDKLDLAVSETHLGLDGAGIGVASGIFAAAVCVTVSPVRGSAIGPSHGFSLSP
jgi:hypothetical protein